MDAFREHWPQVELDLVSGFHADPVGLLGENRADLVIVSHAQKRDGVSFHPLFSYEVLALVSRHHPLARKPFVTASDFKNETLVTYPIPDDRLDLVRDVLQPAKVNPERRKTELTVAILQLGSQRARRRGASGMDGSAFSRPQIRHRKACGQKGAAKPSPRSHHSGGVRPGLHAGICPHHARSQFRYPERDQANLS